ncbi:MAG: hopanoid biosynthesis-associated protein HpnK [Gammaproteobacteria bacterium]|nr:hopanoid biosynthesis-associated protein HpnK [Gammaproteobacteria bacterium]
MKRRRVIVTADDFGLAIPVNEAVEIAHRDGILGGASLMVAGAAAADAVERTRRLPGLRVGLHVVLVDGRPILPPESVPDLVDRDGRFSTAMFRTGVRYFFLPRVRRQLEAEIRAQFEAYRATGLALDHVNAHKHLHLHPTVLSMILRVGRAYGLHAMRLPYEPARATRCVCPRKWLSSFVWSLLIGPWMALLRWRMRRAGLHFNRFVFGLSTTGAMTEDTVLRILECLPAGVTELYFHPATADHPGTPLPMTASRHAAELQSLISPRVRAAFRSTGIEPVCFSELR